MPIISATVTKETLESKVGIAFARKSDTSPLTIKLIREAGLFAETELKAGMVVDSINGTPMTWSSAKDAADALKASEGEVTISAIVFKATAIKESKESRCGLSLKNSTTKEGMFISKIFEDSLFAGSELKEGLRVLYINGTECPSITTDAIQILKDAEGEVTILAVDLEITEEDPAVLETDVIEEKKEESGEKEGTDPDLVIEEPEELGEKSGLFGKVFGACTC